MKCVLCCIVGVFIITSSFAQTSFEILKEQYTKATERAVDPIKKTYINNLNKLLESSSKKGDLKEVEMIINELKLIQASKASSLSTDVEKNVVGKTWNCFGHIFSFKANNLGVKKHRTGDVPFTWRKVSETQIEVVGRDTLTSIPKAWIFLFENGQASLIDGEDRQLKTITLEP